MSMNGVFSDCDKINMNTIRRFKVEVDLRTDISYTVNSQQHEYEQESENEERVLTAFLFLRRTPWFNSLHISLCDSLVSYEIYPNKTVLH